LLVVAGSLCGCDSSANQGDARNAINGSIHVSAGTPAGSVATVNGSIMVDDNAALGAANAVNGDVHVGAHAAAASLHTVNGNITLEPGARVSGAVASVNGGLTLHDGSEILGSLTNVNGKIELEDAHVAGGITTVNGSIGVSGASRVERGILVEKPGGFFFHWDSKAAPRIVIGPGAVVQGEMRFERKVELYVSDRATVGPISGATAVRYSGQNPPG
jgi:DUF4097 and DUF4098 domain-containing protein YvlB